MSRSSKVRSDDDREVLLVEEEDALSEEVFQNVRYSS